MSYTCSDAYNDIVGALCLDTPDEWDSDGMDHTSEITDLALAAISKVQTDRRMLVAALRKSIQHCEQLAGTANTIAEAHGLGRKVHAADFTEHAAALLRQLGELT